MSDMSFLTQATELFVAAAWWLGLAVAVAAVIAIVVRRAVITSRKAKAASKKHPVLDWCAAHGHAYQINHTGWRCGICGNYVARREGERYGRPEDGCIDRRREDRHAAA